MTAPLPRWLPLLCLALPGVAITGAAIARRVFSDRSLAWATSPLFALASWLLAVHAVGLATHSFVRGLVVGTLAVAAAGWIIPGSAPDPVAETAPRDLRATLTRVALVILVTLPIARIAFGWSFHDEDLYTGHRSIPAEMQNDIYPPRHLTFAAVELGYHYGFDLLVACIATLTRAPIGLAIDLATVGLWLLTAWLAAALGERLLGPRRGLLAVLTILFAGGTPFCIEAHAHDVKDALGCCTIGGETVAPALVSNFFQHPWALGVPIALGAWLVYLAAPRGRARLAALWLLLVALSFAHVVLFATLLPSLGIAELALQRRERRPLAESIEVLACGLLVGGGALCLSGFLRAPPWQTGLPFTLQHGVVPGHVLMWHLQSLGALLPIGLGGLFLLPLRARVALLGYVALCLLALNLAHYRYSGDSVKFGGAAALGLGVGAAVLVERLSRHPRGLVAAVALVAVTASGLAFTFAFCALPSRASTVFHDLAIDASPDDARAAAFLRSRMGAGEVLYRRDGPARAYVLLSGLPTAWVDWGVSTFGFPDAWMIARRQLLRTRPAPADAWRAQGIVWFVLDGEEPTMSAHADDWIARGEATEVARFGALRVIRLAPLSDARSRGRRAHRRESRARAG